MTAVSVPALAAYLAVTFLVCGIPFGAIVARSQGVDIRAVGSGNIGTTNVAREVGKGAAAATLAFDAGKGALATGVATALFPALVTSGAPVGPADPMGWTVGLVMLAAIYGHVFSPFLRFHGGKGIAVGVGSLLGFAWVAGLVELAVFALLVGLTRRVSVGSVTVAAVVGVTLAVLYGPNPPLDLVVELGGLTVVWAHRSNIRKLLEGREAAFRFHRAGEPTDPAGDGDGGRR